LSIDLFEGLTNVRFLVVINCRELDDISDLGNHYVDIGDCPKITQKEKVGSYEELKKLISYFRIH
jgi:hypothetical protein